MSFISALSDEKREPIYQPKAGQADYSSPQAMGRQTQKESSKTFRPMREGIFSPLLPALAILFSFISCSSGPKASIPLRDHAAPPGVVQEAFAREGKSDYFLVHDEGYSFRLI